MWNPVSSARAGLSPKIRGTWERQEEDQGRWSVSTRRGREKEEKKTTKEGGLSPQEGDLEKVQEKKKTMEGEKVAPAKARFRVSSTKNFFFGSRVFGLWETRLIWISAPTRLSLRGSYVRRKFRKWTTLRSESSTLKGLLYAPIKREQNHKDYSTQVEDPAANVARNAALLPSSEAWARKLSYDKRQSTFIHEFGILWWFPTWAVLRSLNNARKCQLEDFCDKKWENNAFCTGNMGAHVRGTYPKKLVSGNLAKILEVATKIRETCEKTLFTPYSPSSKSY